MSTRTSQRYRIKDLSEIAEVSRRAIRYYVQRGLIDPPLGAGRGSYYTAEHLKQLLVVKEAQEKGYSLEEIEAANYQRNELEHLVPSSVKAMESSLSLTTQPIADARSLLSSNPPPLNSPPLNSPRPNSPPPNSQKSLLLDEDQSTSTWLRLKVDEQIEIHLREGALSSSELADFRVHILNFFRSQHLK